MSYCQSALEALNEHMRNTEAGLRALTGMSEQEIERLVASVRRRHEKLVKGPIGKIAAETKHA